MILVDRVTRRLRAAGRVCRTVVLRLRFSDYSRATRSCTMLEPTADTQTILAAATGLLTIAMPVISRRGLTLIGIALTNLGDQSGVQLRLPFERVRELDETLDRIRDRFGSQAVTRGTLVGRDPGPWVPLLPD
jgi:DNA polymerase-4